MKTEWFSSEDFKKSFQMLKQGVESDSSFILLLGSSGSGKTSLIRALSQELDKTRYRILYLAHGQMRPATFTRVLATHLHLPHRMSSMETGQMIIQTLKDQPVRLILILDEAHCFSNSLYLEIKLLAEAQLDPLPVFSVCFSGLPELKERLFSPMLAPLWRRFSPKIILQGLIREEVKPYLEFCLSKKSTDRLSDEALSILFEQSKGIPGILKPMTMELLSCFPSDRITHKQVHSWIGTRDE
jgi:type II secretory pathway predicted ATPase ExeA